MSHTVFNLMMLAAFTLPLGGCGLAQTVADGTASTAKAIFYKQVKTLHLDFSARTALNTDATDMRALSVPTLVRVYQLRDNKAMALATYEGLLDDDERLLASALLDKRSLVVKPEEGAQLNVPMHKDAQFVTLVALFRDPDTRQNTWRLTLARDDLEPDRARVIELGDNRLTLRPLAKD
ncbi:type VI secretion system protein VasD [Pseudomonas marginalis]|uniref:type VI secretion system lipoprotein TssJ n=1 Tax=Pseudomonas marginalis TaxID=298 RepID=UPI00209F4205|nr:type VI secretion system lipoprotein TssJ [Pseudomonas marginalis]MCP1507106.1 type VI secretion system protein VasD [Pseudomonas marginalis]MCP1524610.1 type VI secretion system protein VasD [Pseudomonas marginalis]MDQ0500021.1 type VI secretion system protein VasD [Pseudomonas marginalis]